MVYKQFPKKSHNFIWKSTLKFIGIFLPIIWFGAIYSLKFYIYDPAFRDSSLSLFGTLATLLVAIFSLFEFVLLLIGHKKILKHPELVGSNPKESEFAAEGLTPGTIKSYISTQHLVRYVYLGCFFVLLFIFPKYLSHLIPTSHVYNFGNLSNGTKIVYTMIFLFLPYVVLSNLISFKYKIYRGVRFPFIGDFSMRAFEGINFFDPYQTMKHGLLPPYQIGQHARYRALAESAIYFALFMLPFYHLSSM